MATCRACGATAPDEARFCPTCGNAMPAALPPAPAEPAAPPAWSPYAPPLPPPPQGPGPRPLGVLLVSLWNMGIGALVALFGLVVAVFAPFAFADPATRAEIDRQIADQFPVGLLAGAFVFLGIFALLFGAAMVAVGWGLYHGRAWAWTGMVVLIVVNAAWNLLTLPFGVVGLLINAFLLWYFHQPGVKRYFGKEAPSPQALLGYVPPPPPTPPSA